MLIRIMQSKQKLMIIHFVPRFNISHSSYISDASLLIIPRCIIAMIRITINKTLEIDIAYPAELDPKHREYEYTTKVVDALLGPPPSHSKNQIKTL